MAERQVLFRSGPLRLSFFTLLKTFEHIAGILSKKEKTTVVHGCVHLRVFVCVSR